MLDPRFIERKVSQGILKREISSPPVTNANSIIFGSLSASFEFQKFWPHNTKAMVKDNIVRIAVPNLPLPPTTN